MRTAFLLPKSKKFVPFLVIVAVVFLLLQRQQSSGPLPAPKLELLEIESRSTKGTEFTLADLSGKHVRLADFRGNVVVLNFFATWCGPCRKEMPGLEKLYQHYQHKGLVVVGVSGDVQGKDVVDPFVKEYNLTFPVVLDPQNTVSKQYRVRGIPTIYLLDRQGRIAGMHVGGADWNGKVARKLIEQLLEES
jgi:peroxiredoxin